MQKIIAIQECSCVCVHTLCEELQGADFLSDAKLQDLLQNVLSLALLHDPHPLQLPVCQPHQSPACRYKEVPSKLLLSDVTVTYIKDNYKANIYHALK